MAQLIVRNIEDQVKAGLQRRARRNGRSMEQEVREILRDAAQDTTPTKGLGSAIAARFARFHLETPIPELRGESVRPASFRR